MSNSTELTVVQSTTPAQLLSQAIDKGMGVAEIEKLVALQERWEDRQAEKAFNAALSAFQEECPEIRKTKNVSFDTKTGGNTSYNYTPLADIIRQIKAPLKKNGLSFRWRIREEGERIKVACLLSHIDGHTDDSAEMSTTPDTSGGKNAIQARGSAIEYMKRYTLEGACGLTTAEDNDGKTSEYEYDVDKLHVAYMEVYNQVIAIEPVKYAPLHPDNWLIERTGKNYVKAIGEIRKILFTLQKKKV